MSTLDATLAAALPRKVLVGACGSVALLALPMYLNMLRGAGVQELRLVLTATAEKFLPASSLRHISESVHTEADHGPGHVALARWAELVLILPATAHLIGCAAAGLAPNLLSTLILAHPNPITFVPAMNPQMWQHKAVQRNVARLRADGHAVIDPVPATAYEVASRSLRPSLVAPPPDQLVAQLLSNAAVAA